MEIQTAFKASSSSCVQLNEQVNSINSKTEKLSTTDDSYAIGKEEDVEFINKAKNEINCFIQLLRGIINGSLEQESIPELNIEILDIYWNRSAKEADFANPNIVSYDIYCKRTLEEPIMTSIGQVQWLLDSDKYPSLRDDLKALQNELDNWENLDFDKDCGSYSDSDDEGISDYNML